MNNPSILLSTKDLRTGYRAGGKKVLVSGHLPDLEIKKGQLICLLGPNGSGKSTLLRTLSGLQPALAGSVAVGGKTRLSPNELARQMSLVLSERVKGNNLTVHALVSLGRFPYSGWMGKLDQADEAIIEKAMATTGTTSLRERKLATLSDGENQKVMLARALAQDTLLLLLDEPTAHLDWPSRLQLLRLLHQLAAQTGRGILLSTHELELALQIADEIWLLEPNGSFHRGAPEDLVLDGSFTKAFAANDVVFDLHTGTFILPHPDQKPIGLSGEGVPFYWTKRALEREGYQVFSKGDTPVHIQVLSKPAGLSWLLGPGTEEKEYSSIALLLQALQEII